MSKTNEQFNNQNEKQQHLHKLRHSCEHILTMAIRKFYPDMKMAMGPATDEGFYFDVDLGQEKITDSDFKKIEKEMWRIINSQLDFVQEEIEIDKARKIFEGNPYKQEWLDEIEQKGEKATVYYTGRGTPDEFVDLCSGPHVDNTSQIKAFKLLKVAGAYWRGNEKNKMLTRIYGTAFANKEDLKQHLWMLEEAKKRDHRKIGKEQDLFTFDEEIGPGLPIWMPNGTIIKDLLENWAKDTEQKRGYQRVSTPVITKENLFYTSGHLPLYKDSMYAPIKIEEDNYYIKPMNCPFHHKAFAAVPRSYKELPLRIAEYGLCHRYEDSGSLFGLMRVRSMQMNDAHIYCSMDQAIDEFVQVIKLHEYYYQILGIKEYEMELALRDPNNMDKYHGDEKDWQLAEKMTIEAMEKSGVPYKIVNEGAAFYGPKMDFQIKSSIGRAFTASTNQLDLYMGKRFNLKFINQNGEEETPAIIHRAPLGTHERFIGFLIEHYAGAFPLWLAPIQAVIIPISEKFDQHGQALKAKLEEQGIRVEMPESSVSMQKRIRDAEKQKIPYMLVVGEKEEKNKGVSLRARGRQDLGSMKFEEFMQKINMEIKEKTL
jgi:threonyl-tRNA synthetase